MKPARTHCSVWVSLIPGCVQEAGNGSLGTEAKCVCVCERERECFSCASTQYYNLRCVLIVYANFRDSKNPKADSEL